MTRWWMVLVVLGLAVTPAHAQDTYVGAALTGDIVRFSGPEDARLPQFSGGEALGFALRLGTRLGTAWGVEAEFARPAEIRREGTPQVVPFRALDIITVPAPDGSQVTIPRLDPLIFPPLNYRIRTAYRDVTFSAGVWARQDLSARLALVYTGGIGFHRTERDVEITFEPIGIPFLTPPVNSVFSVSRDALIGRGPATYGSAAIAYTARPFAGFEARVRMTDRLDLVPGVRLHGVSGGLLVRPSVGLSWGF